MNDVKKSAQAIHLPQLTCERGSEIKPESVDMHLQNPVSQAVHDQLKCGRMSAIERIAATGKIDIMEPVGLETVICGVVDAAQG